ncbi:MAG: hypothetical protein HY040_14185 [Planctomycetes bacterium]|nr:hypothetical protein [Planctomycetota bacterium]
MRAVFTVIIVAGIGLLGATNAQTAELTTLLARIHSVGKEGKGNADAARAWRELVKEGPDALMEILTSLDDASPTAANWLRSAIDAIAEKTQLAGKPLPAAKFEAFVRETRHSGQARRLAYEWLVKTDATAAGRLLPGMLNDPGAELRREAVELVLKDAHKLFDKDDKPGAIAAYKKALESARDIDQIQLIEKRFKKMGVEFDLTAHLGFITRWMIAGPFDNTQGKGYHTEFPPDKGVDLKAVYTGKDKKEVRWQEFVTTQPLGVVDFKKPIGALQGALAYAYTAVNSEKEQRVEIRCASGPAVRIYLNGKEIYTREEYHHGVELDQHIAPGVLKEGRNEILVKVCNNELKEDKDEPWAFQLRICDALGTPVRIAVVTGKR